MEPISTFEPAWLCWYPAWMRLAQEDVHVVSRLWAALSTSRDPFRPFDPFRSIAPHLEQRQPNAGPDTVVVPVVRLTP